MIRFPLGWWGKCNLSEPRIMEGKHANELNSSALLATVLLYMSSWWFRHHLHRWAALTFRLHFRGFLNTSVALITLRCYSWLNCPSSTNHPPPPPPPPRSLSLTIVFISVPDKTSGPHQCYLIKHFRPSTKTFKLSGSLQKCQGPEHIIASPKPERKTATLKLTKSECPQHHDDFSSLNLIFAKMSWRWQTIGRSYLVGMSVWVSARESIGVY